jgi:hypothetical protein
VFTGPPVPAGLRATAKQLQPHETGVVAEERAYLPLAWMPTWALVASGVNSTKAHFLSKWIN